MNCWRVLVATLACSFLAGAACAASAGGEFDVVVYGGTSGGVMSAVAAARMGKSVALVVPGRHLGGMTSGGLGWVDMGRPEIVGGLAREFFHRVYVYYQSQSVWNIRARGRNSRMHGRRIRRRLILHMK